MLSNGTRFFAYFVSEVPDQMFVLADSYEDDRGCCNVCDFCYAILQKYQKQST